MASLRLPTTCWIAHWLSILSSVSPLPPPTAALQRAIRLKHRANKAVVQVDEVSGNKT